MNGQPEVLVLTSPPSPVAKPVDPTAMPQDVQVLLAAFLAPLPPESVVTIEWARHRWARRLHLEIPLPRDSRFEPLMRTAAGIASDDTTTGNERIANQDVIGIIPPGGQLPRVYRYWQIEWSELLTRRVEVTIVAKALHGGM